MGRFWWVGGGLVCVWVQTVPKQAYAVAGELPDFACQGAGITTGAGGSDPARAGSPWTWDSSCCDSGSGDVFGSGHADGCHRGWLPIALLKGEVAGGWDALW